MKQILTTIESYLRRFPSPTGIQMISNSILKLNYSFTIPYTNSKNIKQLYYPISQPQLTKPITAKSKKLKYDQKGRIEQSSSFQTISCQGKHDKVLQDDVFGVARQSYDKNRWVYIAQVKQQKAKSYFNKGQGKTHFQYDFGETYQGVKNVKIFVWDKTKRQILKIQTPHQLIPACPMFSNKQGSKIIFHAYKKSQFGHGLLHCFNRQVGIYEISFTIQDELQDAQKQLEQTKKKIKQQKQRLSKITKLVNDGKKTNIFPSVSKCYQYLVYCSGEGKTHTYYLDLVVMKREQSSKKEGEDISESKWVQSHRIKQKLVGYYSTLKLFPSFDQNNRPICYFQSIEKALQRIYKIDLQSGQVNEFSSSHCGQSFAISQVLQQTGMILGTTTTHNFNTFFYTTEQNQKIATIPPPDRENFTLQQYHEPIHGYYLEAPQQAILPQYRQRAKNRPMILLAHGGPHGAVDPTLTLLRYTLLKMGYSLLMPNFPGSAGYGQQYLQKALKNIGQTDMDTIIQLLKKVLSQKPYINKKKVHIYGGSYGGYSGGILGSRYSQHFASAIILNGVLSIPSQLFFTDIPQWNTVEALGKEELHELTAEDFAQMYRQSPISQPMKVPVLQFLGAKDLRVPYRQGLLFDAITKRQGTDITTYVYENSSHSLADSVDTVIDVIVKSLLFLQGELKKSQAKAQQQIEKAQGDKVIVIEKKQSLKHQQYGESAQKVQQEMKENQNL